AVEREGLTYLSSHERCPPDERSIAAVSDVDRAAVSGPMSDEARRGARTDGRRSGPWDDDQKGHRRQGGHESDTFGPQHVQTFFQGWRSIRVSCVQRQSVWIAGHSVAVTEQLGGDRVTVGLVVDR